jgi:hypothetical protein
MEYHPAKYEPIRSTLNSVVQELETKYPSLRGSLEETPEPEFLALLQILKSTSPFILMLSDWELKKLMGDIYPSDDEGFGWVSIGIAEKIGYKIRQTYCFGLRRVSVEYGLDLDVPQHVKERAHRFAREAGYFNVDHSDDVRDIGDVYFIGSTVSGTDFTSDLNHAKDLIVTAASLYEDFNRGSSNKMRVVSFRNS